MCKSDIEENKIHFNMKSAISPKENKVKERSEAEWTYASDIPIRAIRFDSIGQDKSQEEDQLIRYFNQFGVVDGVDIHTEGGSCHGIVRFKKADSTSLVLLQETHRIGDNTLDVRAAHAWEQPDHILNVLNDDCLLKIFAYLNLSDLTNAADVCVRFNQQVELTFKRKCKNLDLLNTTLLRGQIKNLLRHFGRYVCSLKVNMLNLGLEENVFMDLILECCTSDLKELWLISFDWGKLSSCRSLTSLDKVVLDKNQFSRSTEQFFASSKLKELRVDGCSFEFSNWVGQQFEKLREAHFAYNSFFTSHILNNFIISNPNLIKLSVAHHTELMFEASESVRCIGQNLQHLQEFTFSEYIRPPRENIHNCLQNIQFLGQFNQLLVLKFNFTSVPIAPLIESLAIHQVPIEHLQLELGTIDDNVIKNLIRMKKIEILKLRFIKGLFEGLMAQLAKGLPQLKEIHLIQVKGSSNIIDEFIEMLPHANQLSLLKLDPNYHITPGNYAKILEIAQKRPGNIKLSIELWGNYLFEHEFPETELLKVFYHKRWW